MTILIGQQDGGFAISNQAGVLAKGLHLTFHLAHEYRGVLEPMTTQDIRWQQRFANYERALARLSAAVDLASQRALSDLEKQGLIQAFEFTHELAWNVMKDYLVWQGAADITGSRDATRDSFSRGIIEDGEGWMEMIKSRNQTSHTYNEKVADEIAGRIIGIYHALFVAFASRMRGLQQ